MLGEKVNAQGSSPVTSLKFFCLVRILLGRVGGEGE